MSDRHLELLPTHLVLVTLIAFASCTRPREPFRGQSEPQTVPQVASAPKPTEAADGGIVMSCAECERVAHKGNTNCPDSTRRCDSLPGTTAADSPMPNMPRSQLCRQIVDCIHRTHCAKTFNATDCLCGKDVNPDECFAGTFASTTGACKELFAAGGESTSMEILADRFSDPTFAVGVADTVLETCDFQACWRECL
jgi:hypothetical protein